MYIDGDRNWTEGDSEKCSRKIKHGENTPCEYRGRVNDLVLVCYDERRRRAVLAKEGHLFHELRLSEIKYH